MPPRLPLSSSSWRPVAESVSCSLSSSTSIIPGASTIIPSLPTFTPNVRSFSATAPAPGRSDRRKMRAWLKRNDRFKGLQGEPESPRPMYLGPRLQPFPMNPLFSSKPVLSESARELVWEKVMVKGEPIKSVSAELGIDVRRIGAVIRLKEVEKDWIANKKPLARPYAKAFMSMLPQTSYENQDAQIHHEPFNEVTIHPYTRHQLFFPVSESRDFNRVDAAKAFNRGLKPTDERIPHPELVEMERQINVNGMAPLQAVKAFRQATAEAERLMADKAARAAQQEASMFTRVNNKRGVEIRFKDYNVDSVGKHGIDVAGVGVRYGVAPHDRKRGRVGIPTKVE